MRRLTTAFLLSLGIVATISGCTLPVFACPAIGYSSIVSVTLEKPQPGLTLTLCDGEGCEPVGAQLSSGGETEPGSSTSGVMSISGDSENGWEAWMWAGKPVLGYRLSDSAGNEVASGFVDTTWVRVSGSEQCGGNRQAEVTLST